MGTSQPLSSSLENTFRSYETFVSEVDTRDIETIESVDSAARLASLLKELNLPDDFFWSACSLQSQLEALVSSLSRRYGDRRIHRYVWGSIFLISKVSLETLEVYDLSGYNTLKLLYNCSLKLPQDIDPGPDQTVALSAGLSRLIDEIYSSLILIFGTVIKFFRTHPQTRSVKNYWQERIVKPISDTKSSLEALSERVNSERKTASRQSRSSEQQPPRALSELNELVSDMRLERRRTQPQPVNYIPSLTNIFFAGREDDIRLLQDHVRKRRAANEFSSIVLSGFPGVGKSQLALRFAQSFEPPTRDFFPIFWIHAASKEKLEQDICTISSKLGILPEDTNPAERGIRAKMELMSWLSNTHHDHKWMIVFDNVHTFKELKESGCWPPSRPGCAVVITSREYAFGGTTISLRHQVKPLKTQQTADLILSIIDQTSKASGDKAAAKEIAEEVGGLPLAVIQIASYILENTMGLRNFLPIFRQHWRRIYGADVNIPDYEDYQNTLINIWQLSSQRLGAAAKILGEMLAFLQPDGIPRRFFGGICDIEGLVKDRDRLKFLQDEFDLNEAKKSLEKLALLQIDRATGDMQVHRSIQLVVLYDMEKPEREKRFEDVVQMLRRAFPEITSAAVPNSYKREKWHLAQDCLPHVLNLKDKFLEFKFTLSAVSGFPQLLSDTSWYLYETGQFERAMMLLETAEHVCEGGDPGLRASTRSIRALIYHHQNNQGAAKQIWEENLALRRRLHGENHFLVGANLCNLGAVYGELGDMAKCRQYFEEGQAHRQRYHPDHLSDLALHDCNYSSYLIHNGDLDDAEKVVKRALDRYRACEKEDGFGYNQALFFLAKLRTAQKSFDEALILHTKALTTRRKIMRNHYYTCVSFYHTADVADLVGDQETAIQLLEESLKDFESIPEARNYVARSFFRLCCIHREQGRETEAESNLRRAKDILREIGVERPGTNIHDYEVDMPIRFR